MDSLLAERIPREMSVHGSAIMQRKGFSWSTPDEDANGLHVCKSLKERQVLSSKFPQNENAVTKKQQYSASAQQLTQLVWCMRDIVGVATPSRTLSFRFQEYLRPKLDIQTQNRRAASLRERDQGKHTTYL